MCGKKTGYYDSGITIILPVLNEEENIKSQVQEILDYLSAREEDFEIIIVNDGSTDRTPDIAEQLCRENEHVRVIHHPSNKGYGTSLADGFMSARRKYIFFTDADRQFYIDNLDILFPLMKTDVMDIIVGYRLNRKDPFFRRFLSWGYNSMAGFIFDLQIKDIDCAFKIFKRTVFDTIQINSRNFFVNTEILAKARFHKLRILEVGVDHFPRSAGQSTVSMKYIPVTLKEMFRIWRELKRMKKDAAQGGERCSC